MLWSHVLKHIMSSYPAFRATGIDHWVQQIWTGETEVQSCGSVPCVSQLPGTADEQVLLVMAKAHCSPCWLMSVTVSWTKQIPWQG